MSQKLAFIIIGVAVFLIMGFSVLHKQIPDVSAQSPVVEETNHTTRYLAFQVFIGALDPRVSIGGSGINPFSPSPSKAAISEFVQDIIDRIGVKGNEQTRLAFIEGPFCFDHSDSDINRVIGEAFEVALEKDIAVGFHIDDSMFWARRSDLWGDPNNIEWLDWDGTVNTGRKIDWGHPEKLAPQMCFNSKAIQAEVRRRATFVIGKAIKEGIDKLKQAGKEELFAGVIVGWETQIGRDFDSNRFLGYCALTNRGFNKNNPPQDLDSEREKVVQEFIELWAKGIFDAGINPDKIYSHTAFLSKKVFDIAGPSEAYSALNGFAPPPVAFGSYHNPGFSTYPQAGLTEQIYEELAAHNNPHWASCEGTNLQPGYGPGESGMNMETYLAKMFNHGAILVNIFAWGIGGDSQEGENSPFRIATEGKEAIDAYRKFLKGEELTEQISSPHFSMETLAAKVQKIQKEAPAWVQRTGNQAKVEPLLQRLDQYIKEPNPREAERVADEILELIGSEFLLEEQQINKAGQYITIPKPVKLGKIPASAAIVFWSTRGVAGANQMAPSNVYVTDKDGGHVTQITFKPENYQQVAVSPDRRYVAAARDIYSNKETTVAVYVLDLEKGTEARLLPNFHSAGSGGVDWSPDGFVYFVARPGTDDAQNIYKIKPDGTGFKQLTFNIPRRDPVNPDPASYSDLSVSEDGSLIAAFRMTVQKENGQLFQKPQIWVMNNDGTNQRMIDDGGLETGASPNGEVLGDYDPEISPDNRYVIFSRSNSQYVNFKDSLNTAHDLWIAPLDGSSPAKRITQQGPVSIIPDWHDGRILYTEYNEKGNYVGLVTMDLDGTGRKELEHFSNIWDGGRHGKWIPAPSPTTSSSFPASAADETQYLVFGISVKGIYESPEDQTYGIIDRDVQTLISRVGALGDGTKRQLGFMFIIPPWMLEKVLPGKMEWIIKQAFEVAKKRNVAAYFTIESHFAWENRPDLWNWFDPSQPGYNPQNKKNVEWTDWDGTPVKARYSLQLNSKLKQPHMCYNSPKILSEISRLVSTILTPSFQKGIDDLKASGKENLFAGITLTGELSVDDYSVIDRLSPALSQQMTADGALKARLGYCALTNVGYSKSNPPTDFPAALAKINQEFAAYWAKQFVSAGIPAYRLYNHVGAGAEGAVLQYTNAPIWSVFNDYSRPGWTTYPDGPIADNFDALYKPLAEHGNPHWASTEASPNGLGGKNIDPTTYLNWHFDHGATVMVLNGADESVGGQIISKGIWSPAAIAAFKNFLSGEKLSE